MVDMTKTLAEVEEPVRGWMPFSAYQAVISVIEPALWDDTVERPWVNSC